MLEGFHIYKTISVFHLPNRIKGKAILLLTRHTKKVSNELKSLFSIKIWIQQRIKENFNLIDYLQKKPASQHYTLW